MFLDYKKESIDLVLDLINRDNPQLDYPLTRDNCIIGKPVALTTLVEFRNTSVMVTYKGEPAEHYTGPVRLYYRRLTGPELFPGGRVVIDHYRASGNIPKQEYIDFINDRYGTLLQLADISSGDMSNTVHTGTINFQADCLAYVGNIPYRRIQSLIPISVPVPAVGNNWLTVQNHGLDYTPVLYGADFTPFDHLIRGAGNTFQNPVYATPLKDVMSEYAGVNFRDYGELRLNASTIRATVYNIPNAAASLANQEYNHVMIITPVNANSWLKGALYLHFNEDL